MSSWPAWDTLGDKNKQKQDKECNFLVYLNSLNVLFCIIILMFVFLNIRLYVFCCFSQYSVRLFKEFFPSNYLHQRTLCC
jgi:hypothetical protein